VDKRSKNKKVFEDENVITTNVPRPKRRKKRGMRLKKWGIAYLGDMGEKGQKLAI